MNFMCRQDSGEPVGLKSRMDERPDRGDEGSKAPDEWSWPVDSPRRFAGFDVDYAEAKTLLPMIENILEQGNFPVKTKVGNIYDKLKTISLTSK